MLDGLDAGQTDAAAADLGAVKDNLRAAIAAGA